MLGEGDTKFCRSPKDPPTSCCCQKTVHSVESCCVSCDLRIASCVRELEGTVREGPSLEVLWWAQVCKGIDCRGKVLPACSFSRNNRNLHGLHSYCKSCNNMRAKHRYHNLQQLRSPQGMPCVSTLVTSKPRTAIEQQHLCRHCGNSEAAAESSTSPPHQISRKRVCSDCRFWQQKFQEVAQSTSIARQAAHQASRELAAIRKLACG